MSLRPFVELDRPLEAIRQFTPNWFAVTMGVGVVALVLAQVPVPGLRAVGEALWLFDIGLFLLFSGLYAARWTLFGGEARRIFGHATASMFIGTIPMGLATIINGFVVFGLPRFGQPAIEIAHALWWVDAVLAVGCGVLLPYLMFTRQEHALERMTAVWLLPVVAAEVTAASAGLVSPHLADPGARFVLLVSGYVLWAYSVPIAFAILTILLLRMALHRLPPADMAASSWLTLGPIGTGALGLLLLGGDASAVFAQHGLAEAGKVAQGLGVIGGLALWGLGLWWLLLALLITGRHVREGAPFNLGWWGYVFPLGVYTLVTLRLGGTLDLVALKAAGAVLAAALVAVWGLVAARTLRGAWRGGLFSAPCLARADY